MPPFNFARNGFVFAALDRLRIASAGFLEEHEPASEVDLDFVVRLSGAETGFEAAPVEFGVGEGPGEGDAIGSGAAVAGEVGDVEELNIRDVGELDNGHARLAAKNVFGKLFQNAIVAEVIPTSFEFAADDVVNRADGFREVAATDGEDPSGPQPFGDASEDDGRFHPVKGVSGGDKVDAGGVEMRSLGDFASDNDARLVFAEARGHLLVRLDGDDFVEFAEQAVREFSGARTEVDGDASRRCERGEDFFVDGRRVAGTVSVVGFCGVAELCADGHGYM